MKKSLTIALVTILAVASIAFAGQWYVWQYDAASVLGNAYAIAPGVSGYQFVPDLVSFTGVDTDTSFEVYSEVDSGVLSTASAVTLTTVTIVNATNTAKATAGDVMYKFTGQSSDPNDGTLVWAR